MISDWETIATRDRLPFMVYIYKQYTSARYYPAIVCQPCLCKVVCHFPICQSATRQWQTLTKLPTTLAGQSDSRQTGGGEASNSPFGITVMDRSLGRRILSGQFLNAWVNSSNSFFTFIKLYIEGCNICIFKAIGWAISFIWLSQILSLFPAPPFPGTCIFSRSLSH